MTPTRQPAERLTESDDRQEERRLSEYVKSLGFELCEYGCGNYVHPNPSNPDAAQSKKHHICLPKLKATVELFTEDQKEPK